MEGMGGSGQETVTAMILVHLRIENEEIK
jgi:hypothetical protein